MNKLKKILDSTIAKAISITLIVSFALSIFLFFDFYKRKLNEIKGYYWVYQGDKAFKKQNLQYAIYCYEKGIKLHPKHYRAMYNLANIYVAYEDYYSALKNYEKALKIKPEYEIARIDYAIILSETYKPDRAIEEYEKVIGKAPKFVKIPFILDNKKSYNYNKGVAYYNMGIAYRTKSLLAGLDNIKREDYLNKASDSYQKASDILKSYNSNYNLGLIHQLLKNKNQAGYYYCKAMEINPLEYEAHFNLAVLLVDLKEYEAAAEEFKKAGILLDSKGDNFKTKYIYDILNEVNEKIAINKDKTYFKQEIKEENKEKLTQKEKRKNKKFDEFIEDFEICEKKELFQGDN